MEDEKQKRAQTDFGRWIGYLVIGTLIAIVVGTALGVWVKLFWVGWVLR